jgi:ribosomal protein L35
MTGKTNKSFKKRLRVTRTGKILARAKGQNHFNARERRVKQLQKRKLSPVVLSSKVKNRFIHTA